MNSEEIEKLIEEINTYSYSEKYELNRYNKEAIRFIFKNKELK